MRPGKSGFQVFVETGGRISQSIAVREKSVPDLTVETRQMFDQHQSSIIYWDVMSDLMRDKNTQEFNIPGFRQGIVTYQERESLSLKPLSALLRSNESQRRRRMAFSPTVAMLAGIASTVTGAWPDAAQISLYRDGRDWIGPHTDYEGILGPTPEDVVISTFSLGATRKLGLWPMGISQRDISSASPTRILDMLDGSLFIMRGTMQRDWLHSILAELGDVGARISVILISYQRQPRASQSMLFESREDLPFPRFLGTEAECTEKWLEIVARDGLHLNQAGAPGSGIMSGDAPDLAILHQDLSICSSLEEAVMMYLGMRDPPGVP